MASNAKTFIFNRETNPGVMDFLYTRSMKAKKLPKNKNISDIRNPGMENIIRRKIYNKDDDKNLLKT